MSRVEELMRDRVAKLPSDRPFEYLPAVGGEIYCNICGGGRDKSGEDFLIAVGFGSAGVTANGQNIIDEREWAEGDLGEDSEVTLSMVERLAKTRPNADWRIYMQGPLSGQEYQRQGEDRWVLIHRDEGFA